MWLNKSIDFIVSLFSDLLETVTTSGMMAVRTIADRHGTIKNVQGRQIE
jgi:hypothetical protein